MAVTNCDFGRNSEFQVFSRERECAGVPKMSQL